MNYYLYRHIRLDKNEPFYIGIGHTDNNKYNRDKGCIFTALKTGIKSAGFYWKYLN